MIRKSVKPKETWGLIISLLMPPRKNLRRKLNLAVTQGKTAKIRAGKNDFHVKISSYQLVSKPLSCGMSIFIGHFQGATPDNIPAESGTPVVILTDFKGSGTLNFPRSLSSLDV